MALKRPNPRKDMRSLRRHFYLELSERRFLRQVQCPKDSRLYVRKVQENGHFDVILRNSDGAETRVGATPAPVTHPPWPIGQVLLEPEAEPRRPHRSPERRTSRKVALLGALPDLKEERANATQNLELS